MERFGVCGEGKGEGSKRVEVVFGGPGPVMRHEGSIARRRRLCGGFENIGSPPELTWLELTAVLEALESLPAGVDVRVVTDSQYVVRGLSEWCGSWLGDPVLNRDLWRALVAPGIGARGSLSSMFGVTLGIR